MIGDAAGAPFEFAEPVRSDATLGDEPLDDEALDGLAQHDERLAVVVKLRYFAGMTIEETAKVLEQSPATVKRDWTYARAWLIDRMRG